MQFKIAFGEPVVAGPAALQVPLPWLGGERSEEIFASSGIVAPQGRWTLGEAPTWRLGAAEVDPGADLAGATRRMYGELFDLTRGLQIVRIWNYVPRINALDSGGLENYRAFCRGRSLAFEAEFGSGFTARLPAASAVGAGAGGLAVVFAASELPAEHRENPRQVPAYDYPVEYGPRSPSFARATVRKRGALADVFISGTSAIAGHATLAPGDTAAQLDATVDNLRVIAEACDLGESVAAERCQSRHFKVYLRSAEDYLAVSRHLKGALFRPSDRVVYLQADICRAALNVEIEATLMGAAPLGGAVR